jgi:hypothetical protein
MITIPRWNQDWETADPLCGKRGWTYPDYIQLVAVAVLIGGTLSLLAPAVANMGDKQAMMRARNRIQRELITQAQSLSVRAGLDPYRMIAPYRFSVSAFPTQGEKAPFWTHAQIDPLGQDQ